MEQLVVPLQEANLLVFLIASPLEEGEDHTDSMTGPSLRTVGPSVRFVVLSDSSHHSGTKSAVHKVVG
ncbi:hypothetical protein Tco_0279624 [Tanacetum coccineum]